jgi:hypothetical protein
MKILRSKKDETKAIVLAMSEDDVEVLRILHEYMVVFGAFEYVDDVSKLSGTEYEPILKIHPTTKTIMRINLVAGFAKGVK